MSRPTSVESKHGVFFPGLVTSEKTMHRFAGALVSNELISEKPTIITVHKQRTNPEAAREAIERSWSGVFHSIGELAIKEAWPERVAFIINPPTPRGAVDLIFRTSKVVSNLSKGATTSINHFSLFREGAKELAHHPLTLVKMGVKGVNYDSINRLASYYYDLASSDRPNVHVIVSPRDPLFSYDDVFADNVAKAGFKLHTVDCGHNGLYTRPQRVLEEVEKELREL